MREALKTLRDTCASCGELSLNYEMIDGGVYCETCAEKKK